LFLNCCYKQDLGLEGITPPGSTKQAAGGSAPTYDVALDGEAALPPHPALVPHKQASTLGKSTLVFTDLPKDCTPLLAFVNSRSGLSQGAYLVHQLRRLLNPIQVVDLANEDPAKALSQFIDLPRLRILVCGGDGTAKWIMTCMEQLDLDCWPPIGLLPLGTGNDLGEYTKSCCRKREEVAVILRW